MKTQVSPINTVHAYTICAKVYEVTRAVIQGQLTVTFAKQKCQELISEYTKTQDSSEVYLIVIPHYFECKLDSQ